MSTSEPRLAAKWRRVAHDLGLDVVTPFELALASGARARVPVLIHGFGGPRGMLIVDEYRESLANGWAEEVVQAGYGFSVMSDPGSAEEYDRAVTIEVLADWGWYGPESEKPGWLGAAESETE